MVTVNDKKVIQDLKDIWNIISNRGIHNSLNKTNNPLTIEELDGYYKQIKGYIDNINNKIQKINRNT